MKRLRALATALLLGCALNVQTIRYPEAADVPPRPEGCEVQVVDWHRTPPPSCADVGDVYVGDPGYQAFCGRKKVERLVRAEACRVGADLVLLRKVGDNTSACFQARARLLRCDAEADAAAGAPAP